MLSLETLDPLATISREDMELFYQEMGEDCLIPEVSSSLGHFPAFGSDSPFSVSNTVRIYSMLFQFKTKMEGNESPGPVVNWKDLAKLTNEIIGIFEWFRTPECERVVRFPTTLSKGSDLLDEEVLELISEFASNHQELIVLLNTSLPSVVNILSPRASAETLRIFMSHNDGILLARQRESVSLLGKLEARVSALETLKHLLSSRKTSPADEVLWRIQRWSINLLKKLDTRVSALENVDCLSFSPPKKAPFSASPLPDRENVTGLPDLGAAGGLFEGDLSDAVLACLILSTTNIVILLVMGAVIGRRNYLIISRTEALELEIRGRGRSRDTHPRRGKGKFDQHGSCSSLSDQDIFETSTPIKKENFSQHGSCSSLSDPDIVGAMAPSCPPFEYHQRETDRCVEFEFHPSSASIVRSSVSATPVASTSGPDRRCSGVSRHSTALEDGHPSSDNKACRLSAIPEEDSS